MSPDVGTSSSPEAVDSDATGPATPNEPVETPQERPQVCTANGKVCEDNAVWECNEDGTERMFMGYCAAGTTCEAGACACVPACFGKACGDDGCGGVCGECLEHATCMPDATCCDNACGARQCGPDACGGSCGECADGEVCLADMGMCCVPACEGKTCGSDGCGGECGECDPDVPCPLNGVCGCEPECEDVLCDVDGCGGLCGDCFTFEQDDGSTETAYGLAEAPDDDPTAIACLVRVTLPHTHMRLTSFTAGWMYGLWELQVPFELVVAPADEMGCQQGTDTSWWLEACIAPETGLIPLTSLLPAPPFEPQPAEDLGDFVMPASEIFIGARFLIPEYPMYVCPVDDAGTGADSFMFPIALDDDGVPTLNASALKTRDSDVGAIAFRFGFELTEDSLPVAEP